MSAARDPFPQRGPPLFLPRFEASVFVVDLAPHFEGDGKLAVWTGDADASVLVEARGVVFHRGRIDEQRILELHLHADERDLARVASLRLDVSADARRNLGE